MVHLHNGTNFIEQNGDKQVKLQITNEKPQRELLDKNVNYLTFTLLASASSSIEYFEW